MCGIAGLIHRGTAHNVGWEATQTLQALKHRGPDSTGFALYSPARTGDERVIRFKLAEQEEMRRGLRARRMVDERRRDVDDRLHELGVQIDEQETITPYAFRYVVRYNGDLENLVANVEDVDGGEVLSLGHSLELVKDLGDAETVAGAYGLETFQGTHAIGHTRMATESDVDIRSAHPYWAYPFDDVSVVHNGQLTNYWTHRRHLERRGARFMSSCDSELIAVYVADQMEQGYSLKEAMEKSIHDLDGVFTYLIATSDSLGMAKDEMAAKPMVLYESDDFVCLASEEVAIRRLFPHEIDTFDPYESEVRVWQK